MDRGSQLSKDDEDDEDDEEDEEEEERRTRQEEAEEEEEKEEEKEEKEEEEATDIKSNNPHLAGGEKHKNSRCFTNFCSGSISSGLIISRLERELARDVKVHIVNGMSGELAAVAGAPSYAAGDLTGFLGVADPKSSACSALTVFQVNFMIIS